MPVLLLVTCLLLPDAGLQAPPDSSPAVLAGPMVGHVGPDRARIWVRLAAPGRVRVEVRAGAEEAWQPARLPDGRLAWSRARESTDGTAVCEVPGLRPGTLYEYRVVVGREAVPAAGEQSFLTPPLPGKPEELRVAFGSCASDWGADPSQPVFRAVDALHPEVFLWLGDNVYYAFRGEEWTDPGRMRQRWIRRRGVPALQPLLRRTAHYAIWDDHDYGPDNADKTYGLRQRSFAIFTRWWANPGWGSDGEVGVWHRFRRGRVEFFLLDLRSHRDPDWMPPDRHKTQLGEVQWRWLEEALAASDADFKILVSSTQVLARYHAFESWDQFPADRERLLRLLRRRRIGGVVLLSGDRHVTELLRWQPPEVPYPLYELTSSPLAAGLGTLVPDEEAPERVPGTGHRVENFGWLEFSFQGAGPELRLGARDVHGRPLYEPLRLRLADLQP